MTREDFRALVYDYAKTWGAPYIASSDVAKFNDFILRHLRKFTAETKCLYKADVTFTCNTTPDGKFDMRDTDYFQYPMLEIRRVILNSNTLPGPHTRTGPLGLEMIELDYQNYRTSSDGSPKVWALIPPRTLLLVPAPSATISNCYVSGWYLHPDFTNDLTELSLNEEDIEAAAYHCAYELILPYASGAGAEKAGILKNLAKEAKAETASRASKLFSAGTLGRQVYRNTRHRL